MPLHSGQAPTIAGDLRVAFLFWLHGQVASGARKKNATIKVANENKETSLPQWIFPGSAQWVERIADASLLKAIPSPL